VNIKEHIEAGHYPKTDGVTEVRTRGGDAAFIYTTRHHPDWPIVGGIDGDSAPRAWMPDGRISTSGKLSDDLLPPPPRKVEVKKWMTMRPNCTTWLFFDNAEEAAEEIKTSPGWRVVELTGSYEEPWIK
jgi:hypothetical protein